MNIIYITLILSSIISHGFSHAAADAPAIYRRAALDDVPYILDLYEKTEGTPAANNIVIFPKPMREPVLRGSIQAGKFFIAQTDESIIGLKKFYELGNDRVDTLAGEIRCIKDETFDPENPNASATFNYHTHTKELVALEQPVNIPLNADDIYFYNGADLTHEGHRGRGINSALTRCALTACATPIIAASIARRAHFVYGLTHENQGGIEARERDGILSGRTSSIAKLMAQFMCTTCDTDATTFSIARFTAKKPEFIMDGDELMPVFPAESNGDGFVVSFALNTAS